MWPFRNSKQIVTVVFEPPQLHISLVCATKSVLVITDSRSLVHSSFEYTTGILFNLSKLQKQIASFIKKHNVTSCFTTFALGGSLVTEQIHIAESSNFKPEHIKGKFVDAHYLYPTNDAQFCYVVTSIAYEHLFQYQLLVRKLSLNLIRITSANLSRLFIYQYIQGVAFRQSQLAHDMQQCNNDIKQLTIPQLSSLVTVQAPSPIESSTLSALTGLVRMDL